jgi:hypothetical protein
MASAERLLRRMEATKFGWGWSDLDTLYRGFGFDREEGSEHTIYSHPQYPELQAAVARHTKLAAGYPATAVKLIRRLRELQAAEDEDEDEDSNDGQP